MAIASVTIYCSSSRKLDEVFYEAGAALGDAVARQGWTLVYGGNRVGLMAAVADAARAAGGRVVGVTPQRLVDMGIGDDTCDELVVTESMRDRKAILEGRGDAFIALPGGLGTFEEFFEILVGRALGFHDKPIVLLDVDGYYEPLLAMLRHGVERKFVREKTLAAFFVARSVEEAMNHLRAHPHSPPAADSSALE